MIRSISVIALAACLILGAGAALAQTPGHEEHHPEGGPPPGAQGGMGMGGKCAMMQKEMDKMQIGMHQAHGKMQGMMHDMNTAMGPAKMEAMAAAINELVAQSERMHQMHTGMMSKMMEHMTEHMMQGGAPKAREEMMMCPMMKGHGASGGEHGKPGEGSEHAPPPADAPKGGEEDHSAHHPPA